MKIEQNALIIKIKKNMTLWAFLIFSFVVEADPISNAVKMILTNGE
jgi:hypothetical protein